MPQLKCRACRARQKNRNRNTAQEEQEHLPSGGVLAPICARFTCVHGRGTRARRGGQNAQLCGHGHAQTRHRVRAFTCPGACADAPPVPPPQKQHASPDPSDPQKLNAAPVVLVTRAFISSASAGEQAHRRGRLHYQAGPCSAESLYVWQDQFSGDPSTQTAG